MVFLKILGPFPEALPIEFRVMRIKNISATSLQALWQNALNSVACTCRIALSPTFKTATILWVTSLPSPSNIEQPPLIKTSR